MQREIYLDNSATTPVSEEVMRAMEPYWSVQYGNPSSAHLRGIAAENTISACRAQLGTILGVNPAELYFTASGTEANNLALQGVANIPYLLRNPGHILTTPIEHLSVLNVVKHLESRGWDVSYCPIDEYGLVDPDKLRGLLRPETRIVSVMLVNNELGTVEPIQELGEIIEQENRTRKNRIAFHVDAVQALGHVPLRIPDCKAHLMSFSAHKIFGPKGIGLLYAQRQLQLRPIMFGGNQENGLRPGTENVAFIVGLTKAVQQAADGLLLNIKHMNQARQALIEGIVSIADVRLNSPGQGAPHLVSASFRGIRGEILVHFLEQKGIFVAMGAACTAKKRGRSHVLEAVGLAQQDLLSAIRFSLSPQLSLDQIKYVAYSLKEAVEEIRSIYM